MSRPRPSSGQVEGRWRACIQVRAKPVTAKTTQAAAKTSMNQYQTGPVSRPLCRSFSQAIQPRVVRSRRASPVARSMVSQPSPPGSGRAT